jgi:hypothetical protein
MLKRWAMGDGVATLTERPASRHKSTINNKKAPQTLSISATGDNILIMPFRQLSGLSSFWGACYLPPPPANLGATEGVLSVANGQFSKVKAGL